MADRRRKVQCCGSELSSLRNSRNERALSDSPDIFPFRRRVQIKSRNSGFPSLVSAAASRLLILPADHSFHGHGGAAHVAGLAGGRNQQRDHLGHRDTHPAVGLCSRQPVLHRHLPAQHPELAAAVAKPGDVWYAERSSSKHCSSGNRAASSATVHVCAAGQASR